MKIKRLHLKGLGEGGLSSKLSDHLFVTYTRTYIKCPVVSLQFRRLMRATLRFKLATVTLSGGPCLIKSWSGRCGKGVGKNVKSIAPPLPNPLNPSPRRGDELVVWSLQTEDQTEKDSTFYHIVCSNAGKEANIHPRNLANFKVRSFKKWFDIINWVDTVNWPSLWVWKLTFRALSFLYSPYSHHCKNEFQFILQLALWN